MDSRKRVARDDASFEFDIGETLHLQTGAKLSVFKLRVADAFLSMDRGQYLYWIDEALTVNWAVLPIGAYTETRLAAWTSSNYASATYLESTNEIGVAYDGNCRILNDYEIQSLFPGTGRLPGGRHALPPPEHQPTAGPLLHRRRPADLHLRDYKSVLSRTDEGHFVKLHRPLPNL